MFEKNLTPDFVVEESVIDGYAEALTGSPHKAAHTVLANLDVCYAEQEAHRAELELLSLRHDLMQSAADSSCEYRHLGALETFVEFEDSVFGFGLALTPPNPSPKEKIHAVFFSLKLSGLEDSSLVEPPVHISVKAGASSKEQHEEADELAAKMTPDDLARLNAMLDKARLSIGGSQQPRHPEVAFHLYLEHRQLIHKLLPETAYSDDQHESSSIYESNIENIARAALRKHVGKKRGDVSVALQYEDEESFTTYYVKMDAKQHGRDDRALTRLKVLSQHNSSSPTIDWIVTSDSEPEELNELEKDVVGIFAAIQKGTQIPESQFNFFWANRDQFTLKRRDTGNFKAIDPKLFED